MKYRKKPVVIEAIQWTGENIQEILDWSHQHCSEAVYTLAGELYIETLEGVMHASVGDYIIRGVRGEYYACRRDIFSVTYEAVEEG